MTKFPSLPRLQLSWTRDSEFFHLFTVPGWLLISLAYSTGRYCTVLVFVNYETTFYTTVHTYLLDGCAVVNSLEKYLLLTVLLTTPISYVQLSYCIIRSYVVKAIRSMGM